jgi:hypothetical protein
VVGLKGNLRSTTMTLRQANLFERGCLFLFIGQACSLWW